MRGRLTVLALLAALDAPVAALQVIDVADGHTVTIQIAAHALTRIGMAGERRIDRVWGLDDRMTVEPDTDGGEVFVRPLAGGGLRPFSFFVRDDAGATYTVIATPVDMPADAVLLRARPGESTASLDAHPRILRLKAALRAAAMDETLPGAHRVTVGRTVPLWVEAHLVLEHRIEGDDVIDVYRLENVSDAEMRLDERELRALGPDIVAIAIDQHVLAPGAATRVLIARAR
ncbi:MAG: type-F conjugative transfer system secretin TraK [Chromatiales bacterium]|nr:type-F conjugative transfer system secretin TraK [Chromatiales bacterium]